MEWIDGFILRFRDLCWVGCDVGLYVIGVGSRDFGLLMSRSLVLRFWSKVVSLDVYVDYYVDWMF